MPASLENNPANNAVKFTPAQASQIFAGKIDLLSSWLSVCFY